MLSLGGSAPAPAPDETWPTTSRTLVAEIVTDLWPSCSRLGVAAESTIRSPILPCGRRAGSDFSARCSESYRLRPLVLRSTIWGQSGAPTLASWRAGVEQTPRAKRRRRTRSVGLNRPLLSQSMPALPDSYHAVFVPGSLSHVCVTVTHQPPSRVRTLPLPSDAD